jgi:hypothetical protein
VTLRGFAGVGGRFREPRAGSVGMSSCPFSNQAGCTRDLPCLPRMDRRQLQQVRVDPLLSVRSDRQQVATQYALVDKVLLRLPLAFAHEYFRSRG